MQHLRLGAFIALTEEVGEVADEIMKYEIYEEKNNINDLKLEIADIFVCLIDLANVYNVDLDVELQNKIKKLKPRIEKWKPALKDLLTKKRDKLD